jgi:hypothetical protein
MPAADLRALGADLRALGLKLKAFRAKHRLSQSDLVDVIFPGGGKSARVVGYIEAGTRSLSDDELARLNAKYPDFADFRVEEEERAGVVAVPLRDKFTRDQQDFLKAHPQTYEMWFINADALPMLRSDEIRRAWVSNINSGINYSLLLDVSVLCRTPTASDRFRKLISLSTKIVGDATAEVEKHSKKGKKIEGWLDKTSDVGHDGLPYGIDVYGYYFGDSPKNDLDRLGRRLYTEIVNDDELKTNPRLRIHPPFDALTLPQGCWRLPIDGYLVNATTVVYLPVSQKAPTYVVLEPLEVLKNFESLEPKEAHVFMGDKAAAEIAALIRSFKEWFHKERPREARLRSGQ